MWKLRDASRLVLGEKLYQEFVLVHPDKGPEPIRELQGVSAINMFVGANHSGKSRLLRALTRDTDLGFVPDSQEPRWELFHKARSEFSSSIEKVKQLAIWQPQSHHPHMQNLVSIIHNETLLVSGILPFRGRILAELRGSQRAFDMLQGLARSSGYVSDLSRQADELRTITAAQAAYQSLLECLSPELSEADPVRVYIPVLRGLRLFDTSQASSGPSFDHYQQRTQKDYFSGAGIEIFTGYTLYHRIKDMLLGRQDERRRVRDYEKFLSKHFFEGKEVTLTPNLKEGVLHVTIAGEEQAIHDVGDGLQSAIILTFEPFVRQSEPCIFFIEEPEMFLHPGLQRHILEFFRTSENHLFFFTTHSNHFLGMSFDYGDTSIYNFQRKPSAAGHEKPQFIITPVSRGHHSSLELLGVQNSSVFLVNATIWVEGVTDRRYIRKFLELYTKQCELPPAPPAAEDIRRLQEDIHYAFAEYAGANLAHWSFASENHVEPTGGEPNDTLIAVRTLCGRAFLIRDEDDTSDDDTKKAKRAQNEQLKALLGERFMLTPGREIENLLPAKVIAAIVKKKAPNVQVDSLKPQDYRGKPLGAFLDEKAGVSGAWGGRYGTLKQKNEFCTKAIQHMDELRLTFADLDEEVQEMVKRICRFLVEQNRFAVASRR